MLSYSSRGQIGTPWHEYNSSQITLYLSVYVNALISFVTPGGRYHVSQSEIQSAISKEPQGIQLQLWYPKFPNFLPLVCHTTMMNSPHCSKHTQTSESCNSPVWIEIIWCIRLLTFMHMSKIKSLVIPLTVFSKWSFVLLWWTDREPCMTFLAFFS